MDRCKTTILGIKLALKEYSKTMKVINLLELQNLQNTPIILQTASSVKF